MKKRILIAIGILVSCAFIFIISKNIDLQELKSSFAKANYIYLLPALVIYLFSFLLRTFRWKYLLEHKKTINPGSLFSCLMIGFMANQILPARIGEFVRAYCLGKKEKISKTLSLGTIVMERLWDALILLLFLTIILSFFSISPVLNKIKSIGALIFLSMLVFIIILTFWKDKTLNFIKSFFSFLPKAIMDKVINMLDMFIDGFKVLRKKKHLFIVTILSICVWLTESVVYFILTKSFNLSVPFYGIVLALIIINVGVMIPSSPGYVGTFEGFCIFGLSFFGVNKETALSLGILLHALMSLPVIIIGLIFFWKENISWSEITHQK